MRFRKFGTTYIIRLDRGEEVGATLLAFCRDHRITLGSFTAIGAVRNTIIGYFDPDTKQYHSQTFQDSQEIASLIGNITTKDTAPYIHMHIVIGDRAHKAHAGHLQSAVVSATCEIVLHVIDGTLARAFDDDVGLNLIQL